MKKNLMKRIASLALALVMVSGIVPMPVFAEHDSSGKPTDLADRVVLAIYKGNGFPGEPAVYGTSDYSRFGSDFSASNSTSGIFANSAQGLFKPEILSKVKQGSASGSTKVWGVYSTGGIKDYFADGSSILQPENELKMIRAIVGNNATLDTHEIVWYVIKYQSGSGLFSRDEWHINGMVKEKTSYAVNYYGNGNTSGSAPLGSTVPAGGSYKIVGNTGNLAKTVAGNVNKFLGWSTDPLASTPQYVAGDEISNVNSNISLYAVWDSKVEYTATVHTYLDSVKLDATDIHDSATQLYVKAQGTEEYIALTKTEIGTYTAKLKNGTYYVFHTENGSYHQIGNHQLLIENANGEVAVHHYSVSYDVNGGAFKNGEDPQTTNYYSASKVNATSSVPIRDGYRFMGWQYGGDTYASGATVTNSIANPIKLTAQWEKSVSVKVNVTIDHTVASGGYDVSEDKTELLVQLLERASGSTLYLETGKSALFSNSGLAGYEITQSWAEGAEHTQKNALVTKYIAVTDTFDGLLSSSDFTALTSKSGYDVVSVTETKDSSGNWTIDVELKYEPSNFDLEFTVEMDSEVPKSLYPDALIVKVMAWVADRGAWEVISQQVGNKPGVRVDIDKETGEGYGTYPVWKYDPDALPYGYRIIVTAFVYSDGRIVAANETSAGRYSDGNYTAYINDVSDGKQYGGVYGAYFDEESSLQKGTLHAVVSVEKYDVTFDAQGGTVNGSAAQTVTGQYFVPSFSGYVPTRDSYEFEGWYLDRALKTPAKENVALYSDITLYAKWNPIRTLTGKVTLDGTYKQNGVTVNLWPNDRAKSVTVVLLEVTPEGNYTIDSQHLNVVWNESAKTGVSEEYCFTDLDGSKTYRIEVIVTNYGNAYQNEKTAVSNDGVESNDYNKEDFIAVFEKDPLKTYVNAYLDFSADSYYQEVEVDSSSIGEGFRPNSVLVDIVYKILGDDDDAYTVISQHTVAPYGIPIIIDGQGYNDGNYGEYVWKALWDGTLYVYGARLVNATVNGNVISYGTDAPFGVVYGDPAAWDASKGGASGTLKVYILPNGYNVYFDFDTDDNVTGMDEYLNEDGTYSQQYLWSYGAEINAVPSRVGYKFIGWADNNNNFVDSIDPSTHRDVILRAVWEKDETQTKSVSYTVQHVINGNVKDTETFTDEIWVNDADQIVIKDGSISAKSYAGYKLDSITPDVKVGDKVDDRTVITLTYVKDDTQTKEVKYTVRHSVDGQIKDSKDIYVTVWVNAETVTVQEGSLDKNTYTGYKYKIMTPFAAVGDEIAFDTVITLNYEKDVAQTKEVSYKVIHNVDGEIKDEATYSEVVWINDVSGITIQANTVVKKTYVGYSFTSVSHNVSTGDKVADKTVITFNYSKDDSQTKILTYTVKHLINGHELDVTVYTETVWINAPDLITVVDGSVAPRNYVGYKPDTVNPSVSSGDKVDNNTTIVLSYVKDESQTKDIYYTVEHSVDGHIRDSKTYTETVWVGDVYEIHIVEGSLAQNNYVGYKYVGMDNEPTSDLVPNATVITLKYEKDDTQTKDVNYTVQHIVGGVIRDTHTYTDKVWVNDQSLITVVAGSLSERSYIGYKYVGISNDSGITSISVGDSIPSGTKITLTYDIDLTQTKNVSYTVNHDIDGSVEYTRTYTDTVWINDNTGILVAAGSLTAVAYTGYDYSHTSPAVSEGSKVGDSTVITLYYVIDSGDVERVEYTVKHIVDGQEKYSQTYLSNVWVNAPKVIDIVSGSLDQSSYIGYKFNAYKVNGVITLYEDIPSPIEDGALIELVYDKDETQTKDLTYTVRHATPAAASGEWNYRNSTTYTVSVWINASNDVAVDAAHLAPNSYYGFKFAGEIDNAPVGGVVPNATVITLKYEKDDTQTKDVSYTVQHIVGGVIRDTHTYTDKVWVNDQSLITVVAGSLSERSYIGYDYSHKEIGGVESNISEGDEIASGVTIVLVYDKDESQTKELAYTVRHETNGTIRNSTTYKETVWINDASIIDIVSGSLNPNTYVGYAFSHIEIDGVRVDGAITEVEDGKVIVLKYVEDRTQTKDVSYTVEHKVNGSVVDRSVYTDKVWVNDESVIEIVSGSLNQKVYTGYKYSHTENAPTDNTVASGTAIVLVYVIDNDQTRSVSYTVAHRVDGIVRDVLTVTDEVWVNSSAVIIVKDGTLEPKTYIGYKLKTPIGYAEGQEVRSGTEIILDYIKDDAQTVQVSYTVAHSVAGSIEDQTTYTFDVWVNNALGAMIDLEHLMPKTYEGYKYSSSSHNISEGEIIPDGTVITLYYVKDAAQQKDMSYTVHHEVDGEVLITETFTYSVWVGDSMVTVNGADIAHRSFVGYKYYSITPDIKNGDKVADGTEITLVYQKDEAQIKNVSYTVLHVIDGKVVDSASYSEDVWINAGSKIKVVAGSLDKKLYTGYKFDSVDNQASEGDMIESGTVITFKYVPDLTVTKTLYYYVHHDVGGFVRDTDVYSVEVWIRADNRLAIIDGSFEPNMYTGYKFSHAVPEQSNIGHDVAHGTIITLYYVKDDDQTKDVYYTVEHIVNGKVYSTSTYTQTVWINDPSDIIAQTGTVDPLLIDGYRFSSISRLVEDGQKLPSGTVITLHYEKDTFKYTVEYYYDGVLDASKTECGEALYETVIESYIDKLGEGYALDKVEGIPLTVGYDAEKNIIRVYYATDVVGSKDGSDGIPDKYQKKITFKVVFGKWYDATTEDITLYLTLTTNGKWDAEGSATLIAPVGMIAEEGHEGGGWDVIPPAVVHGTESEVFTFTFQKALNPPTGDSSMYGALMLMAIASVAIAAMVISDSKKKRSSK